MSETIRETIRVYQAARSIRLVDGRPTHGEAESHLRPLPVDAPIDVAMWHSFARWLEMWERQIKGGGPRKLPSQDKTSAARKEQTKATLADTGLDATAVAYRRGLTTDGVRNLRTKHGLDPNTGEKAAT